MSICIPLTSHRAMVGPMSVLTLLLATGVAVAESERQGDWIVERDARNFVMTQTRELLLHPQSEPQPALKYRLIPDDFDRSDGNAAIYYLKAMGFLEESLAKQRLTEFEQEASKAARDAGRDDWPPYSWIAQAPAELPQDEVREFLQLVDFQPPLLQEASLRRQFTVDRNIRDVENPIAYLLPEIQMMRQLARYQSLRCRFALAEGRAEDALQIVGQQYAMAEHLGHDEFFVSNLVGIAISSMAWNDALHLVQHPDCPNLYWALASLPRPLVGMERALAYERQFLFEQIKSLRDVTDTPRPAGYWQDFVGRIQGELETLMATESTWLRHDDRQVNRVALVGIVAAAYPGARHYLIDRIGMDAAQVDAYPKAQTVFLASKHYTERTRDEQLKWRYLPHWKMQASQEAQAAQQQLERDAAEIGWITQPVQLMLPAVQAIMSAQQRAQLYTALLQTVEAIRLYAARHEGKLPPTLHQLPLPAVDDPLTGAPLEYQVRGDQALLRGSAVGGVQYQLILRIAD